MKGLGDLTGEDRRCPRCGGGPLRPVQTESTRNLVCPSCHRCWHAELSYLIEVNPYACPGCGDRWLCRPL
jgi:DNA-directed RNA polymerase subunit RPC12/RpoP